jgi:hypothetical protein
MEVRFTGHNFENWPPKDHPCHTPKGLHLASSIICRPCLRTKVLHFNPLLWNHLAHWDHIWEECRWSSKKFMLLFLSIRNTQNTQNKQVSKKVFSVFVCGTFIFQSIFMKFFPYAPYQNRTWNKNSEFSCWGPILTLLYLGNGKSH